VSAVASAERVVRAALDAVGRLVGRAQVALVCRRAGDGPLVVLDVDNTLADTWPSFLVASTSERARLAAIEALPNIKAVAHDAARDEGAAVLFLSHRNWWHWPVTYRWLRSHGFGVDWRNLVLVAEPADKLAHLARCARGRSVTVWDDLSYGHETGEIGFYSDLIAAVGALGVEHRGWDEIVAVTGRPLER
jgi:hypothetical protein